MKKTLYIDENPLREAKTASGAGTDAETAQDPLRVSRMNGRGLQVTRVRGEPSLHAWAETVDQHELTEIVEKLRAE